MDMDNFLSPPWPGRNDPQENRAITSIAGRGAAERSAATRSSAPLNHNLRDGKDLRSIVERRFIWMGQAHDRIRRKLLATRPTRS